MFSHPLRLDSSGAIVTVDDNSPQAAAEIAAHVIATAHGERPLAPGYGLPDPVVQGVNPAAVSAAIALCEPDLTVGSVRVSDVDGTRVRISVDVEWSQP